MKTRDKYSYFIKIIKVILMLLIYEWDILDGVDVALIKPMQQIILNWNNLTLMNIVSRLNRILVVSLR